MKKITLMILALVMAAPAFAGEVKGNCTVAADETVKTPTVVGQPGTPVPVPPVGAPAADSAI
ncbi:MAG: hypothetical protein AB7F66_07305 [Bacteriovoracia bacterium]